MKKSLILTSVLALAACGGGSGGGNAPVAQDSGMRVSSDAILSNKNVTSMASEILIAKDGTSPNIVRSSSVVNGGTEYIAYHLDDAKFFENDMKSDEYISFGIDNNGQIDKMMYHWKEGGSDKTESVDRNGPNTNIFTEHVYKYKVEVASGTYYTDSLPIGQYTKQQIKDAFADAYEGEIRDSAVFDEINNKIDSTDMQPIEYVHNNVIDLQGKNLPDSHKLRYSDFGYTTILAKEISEPGDGDGDDNTVVFGGYAIKEIQNPTLTTDMTFSGKAVAALGDVHGNGNTTISTDNTATTLIIDKNGKETLTMPFNDWYTVKVEKPQGESYTISWDGATNIKGEKDYALDGSKSVDNKAFNIKYYGDAGVPSEAVGGIGFQNNGVEFNGAFGVKAQ